MHWSRLFIPTLRENPAEAETASHQLLLRAGYIRQFSSGTYSYLFLAQRSLLKITRIVREEMDSIGAQETLLPADQCSGITHEEVLTCIARGELRSYKQLPQIWYRVQTKFREETAKSGAARTRQFLMKDSYSFDADAAGLDASYRKHCQAYRRIFDRCGLRYMVVGAQPGAMGEGRAQEFVAPSDQGEDLVAHCRSCGYSAKLENAASRASALLAPDPEGDLTPEAFHTPGRKTIGEVAAFTKLPETSQMKSLVMLADGKPVLALLRGDHQLSETKFAAAMGAGDIRPARPEEMREHLGADAGSLGPVGVKLRILVDSALQARRNMIAGANRDDYHLRHVTPGEDFTAEFHDLRQAAAGDACGSCGAPLELRKTIEMGHLFKVGHKHSASVGPRVLNAEGGEAAVAMGSYGIGIERILMAAVEQRHDADGMALPVSIAPFAVVVTPVNSADAAQRSAAEEIYRTCLGLSLDALLDDRDDRPGVKFKDADLIGVPFRITVGKKLAHGMVELMERHGKKSADAPWAEAAQAVKNRAEEQLAT